jgi:FAD/FMN-containing dehydrogenase
LRFPQNFRSENPPVRGQGSPATYRIQEDNITALTAAVRGSVITPANPEYESARKVYNAMIDRHPGIIVRCSNVRDVRTAIEFAREHALTVAIRGGGRPGRSGMYSGRYKSCSRQLWVGSTGGGNFNHGNRWADVRRRDRLSNPDGLALDNLLEADLVLADGSFVTASAKDSPDLFWAIRGGGGNFGVVTSFLFKAHPVPQVFGGPMLWDWEHAREVLEWYRDISPNLPEDLYGFFAFLQVPPGPPFPEELHLKVMCGIIWAYSGPLDQAEEAFRPIRKFRAPRLELVGPMPYLALQSMFDALYPPGHQWYWRGDFLNEIPDAAIDQHLKFGSQLPTLQSTMHFYPVDGFPGRIDRSETAFSFRDAKWSMVIVGVDPELANAAKITAWTKDYWAAIHPYSMGGAYVNFMMEEGVDRIKATYRDNYQRLVAVKRKYDPTNFFHVNQNIKPN